MTGTHTTGEATSKGFPGYLAQRERLNCPARRRAVQAGLKLELEAELAAIAEISELAAQAMAIVAEKQRNTRRLMREISQEARNDG
ncbi:hypothetical protein [Henriciella sp.]|uniref:hypothetical protein n=1 Tax=Henriciella sp. TaxID=1968823 RepID=UPI002603CA42|nr:hypothetical protein [Henriciella sp.]